MRRVFLALAGVVLLMAAAGAEPLADPAREAQARQLFEELRCMVCQNQSLADSDAPLAEDLRTLVRERVEAGDSSREVKDFLVARYGEFVLLRPRFAPHTWLLWLSPALVLLIALLLILRRRAQPAPAPETGALDQREREQLERILKDGGS